MKKPAVFLLAAAVLHGCTGAQFAVPELNDAEVSRAALMVSGDTSDLPVYERTEAEDRALIVKAKNRLRAAAPPLCAHAEVSNCIFIVTYKNDDIVNAYAKGPAEIVIYRGLMKYLKTEDEVAAVIGHEFGHLLAEHIEERQENAMIGSIIAGVLVGGLLAVVASQSSNAGSYSNASADVMRSSMRAGAAVGALSYSKAQEREADLLGAYLLERAGYDLQKAGRLYEVMAQMNRDRTRAGWLDTHPAGPERIVAWQKATMEVESSPDKLPKQE